MGLFLGLLRPRPGGVAAFLFPCYEDRESNSSPIVRISYNYLTKKTLRLCARISFRSRRFREVDRLGSRKGAKTQRGRVFDMSWCMGTDQDGT